MSALSLPEVACSAAVQNELVATLQLQRTAYLAHPVPSLQERRADLLRLKNTCSITGLALLRPSAPTMATAPAMKPC